MQDSQPDSSGVDALACLVAYLRRPDARLEVRGKNWSMTLGTGDVLNGTIADSIVDALPPPAQSHCCPTECRFTPCRAGQSEAVAWRSDLAERLRKAADDFEGARQWHANAEDSDCEPHDSWQQDFADASKAALEAAAILATPPAGCFYARGGDRGVREDH